MTGTDTLIALGGRAQGRSSVRSRTGLLRRERREVRAVDGISFERRPRARWSATSAPTARASRPPSRCSPASSSPAAAGCASPASTRPAERTRLARRIGVVFGQRTTLWWDLPLRDSYELVRRMYRVAGRAVTGRTSRAASNCSTWDRCWTCRCASCRWGSGCAATSRRRCCTTRRCSTSTSRRSAWTWSARRRSASSCARSTPKRGTTVLLTTHDLTDIEQLCSRVMVIDHGRLVYDGDLAGLHAVGESERTLVVDLERELPPVEIEGARCVRSRGPAPVAGVPGHRQRRTAGGRARRPLPAGGPVGARAGHRGRHRPDVRGPGGAVTTRS